MQLKKNIPIILFIISVNFTFSQNNQAKKFLLFWKSDCEGCHVAIPQLVKKTTSLDCNLFQITTVSFDTDSISYFKAINTLKMEKYCNTYNFKEGYRGNKLAQKYNITKTPTLLYLDDNGTKIAEGNDAFKILSSLKKNEY